MAPEPGLTIKGKVIKVHDGDTYTLEIVRHIEVREEDLMSPELAEQGGKEAQFHAEKSLLGKEVTIFVPAKDILKFLDWNSFNRVIARTWVDNKRFRTTMIRSKNGKPGKKMGAS